MGNPVDLLLITWNRREYVEKTVPAILASPSDFRLYCWDNASVDGSADIIASIDDTRVVARHFSRQNQRQRVPCLWFFEQARGDLVGKLDDDVLLPDDWIDRIAPLLRGSPRFGMLSCWVYMPEDWDESLAAHKIIEMEGVRIFRNMWVGGCAFLTRREHLVRYTQPLRTDNALPIDQYAMTRDGLINGFPLPLLMAHHMDDPRSPHCLMNGPGGINDRSSVTARRLGFTSPEAYGSWIAADARQILLDPVARQVERARLRRDQSLVGRIRRKLAGGMRKLFAESGTISKAPGSSP